MFKETHEIAGAWSIARYKPGERRWFVEHTDARRVVREVAGPYSTRYGATMAARRYHAAGVEPAP